MSEPRQNALLTTSQRRYLRGEKEVSNHREYNKRVRDRTIASIEDLMLMRKELDEEEMDKIAEEVSAAEVFQAAAFLDVLGEKSKQETQSDNERYEELEERVQELESSVRVLTNVFESAMNEMGELEE